MKLNKKGFTLIELLAVIVILAIILVITIPTVLGSMKDARKSAFESATKTIKGYVEQQYQSCLIGDTSLTGNIDASVFTTACALSTSATVKADIVKASGYKVADITISNITINSTTGKVTIEFYPSTNGQFDNIGYSSASTYTP